MTRASNPLVSVEPLLPFIETRISRLLATRAANDGAESWRRAEEAWGRRLARIRTGATRRISLGAADELCVALGLHLAEVYPELYAIDDEAPPRAPLKHKRQRAAEDARRLEAEQRARARATEDALLDEWMRLATEARAYREGVSA